MKQSVKTNSEVIDALSECFLVISLVSKPSLSFSTIKALIFLASFSSSPNLAQTIAKSAIEPLVIHILAPLRI